MENSNGQVQKIVITTETASSKLEHLRGILSKLQQTMQARRDERMGVGGRWKAAVQTWDNP